MKRRTFIYTGCGWMIGSLATVSSMGFAREQNDVNQQKSEELYNILKVRCNGCKNCLMACREKAIIMFEGKAWIDPDKCKGCGDCVRSCRRQAIKPFITEKV